MKAYEIGRDIQELRSRIERLEGRYGPDRRPDWTGTVAVDPKAGVDFESKPILWELKKGAAFPPFLSTLFGYPPNIQFNIAPQSKTWTCVPEPLIVYVKWDAGGTDEHFRFSNQVFSIISVTDPNTGIATATAIYSAKLIQRNGRSIDYEGGIPQGGDGAGAGPYAWPSYKGPILSVTLRAAGGAGLFSYDSAFTVACQANHMVNFTSNFAPGLYDLVTGATWQMNTGVSSVVDTSDGHVECDMRRPHCRTRHTLSEPRWYSTAMKRKIRRS